MKNSILNREFKKILYNSKSLHVRDLLFYYDTDIQEGISFIVSRRTGNAVLRNKFKRRCRALFNQYSKNKLHRYKVIIKPVKPIQGHYSWKDLSRSFEQFCIKLGT